MSFEIDEPVHIEIDKIGGQESRYDAWSVRADAWIERDGERICEHRIRLNVLKEDGQFEDEGGRPRIVNRLKERYKDVVKEDPEYQAFTPSAVEEERRIVDKLEGKTFEV